ncbi:MFS transporter [Gulosibacter chungangensis]|uniref:MFS transporter n=1 Tax=Gulosibacter chungangensis TaxID=979746 RepID=A0A7J5BBS8_9MICO|nr:MFS transporter [Gulosibacter chungangensis]KAB1642732.1 MFS transporter [Gulosibacter chungangensis]
MSRRSRLGISILGLIAIALLALNLRTPVSSFSPIVSFVEASFPLPGLALGVIGMLPPLCFAAAGFIARPLTRKFSLEGIIIVSLALATCGFAIRALAMDAWGITLGTALALAALGTGNILMPPIVKARFPKKIGIVTSMYIVIIAISASAPPLLAAQVAMDQGWRYSLAIWGALAVVAMVPWITLWFTDRNAGYASPAETAAITVVDSNSQPSDASPFRSRTAWAIMMLFSVCSLNSYSVFAWLPQILVEFNGLSQTTANLQLSWFALVGIPVGFISPLIAARGTWVRPAAFIGLACFVLGYLLILLVPGLQSFWAVTLIGAGQLLFSMSLGLVGVKAATVLGAARLSSFVQGLGYMLAAGGPFIVSMVYAATGDWVLPLWFLIGTCVVALPAAYLIGRPNDYEQVTVPRAAGPDQ